MPFDEKEWHHCITFIWNAMLSFLQCLKLSLKRIEVKSKVEKLFIFLHFTYNVLQAWWVWLHLHLLFTEKHDSFLVKLRCNETSHDWKMQFQVALPGLSGGLQMWWAFLLNCRRSPLQYRVFKQKKIVKLFICTTRFQFFNDGELSL